MQTCHYIKQITKSNMVEAVVVVVVIVVYKVTAQFERSLCTQQQQLLLTSSILHFVICLIYTVMASLYVKTANLVYIPNFMQMGEKAVISDEQHLQR